jgi:hypothetical protein
VAVVNTYVDGLEAGFSLVIGVVFAGSYGYAGDTNFNSMVVCDNTAPDGRVKTVFALQSHYYISLTLVLLTDVIFSTIRKRSTQN